MKLALLAGAVAACTSSELASVPPGAQVIGTVYARISNDVVIDGGPAYEIGAVISPFQAPADPCAGAIRASGACCLVPLPAPATAPVQRSFGSVTFRDESSGSDLSTIDTTSVGGAILDPGAWHQNDVITAIGSGGAPFYVWEQALAWDVVSLPSEVDLGSAATIAWMPNTGADVAVVELTAPGARITCTADPDAGSVVVDASLLAMFARGDSCSITTSLQTTRYAPAGSGYIAFQTASLRVGYVPIY